MAIVKESQSTGGAGIWKDAWVTFDGVAPEAMKNGNYRAVYKTKDGDKFSLGLDPEEPNVIGFAKGTPPNGPSLKDWFAANAVRESIYITAKDNFIKWRSCALADGDTDKTYEGALSHIYTKEKPSYDNRDVMEPRAVFVLYTDDGERVALDDKTPILQSQIGDGPGKDVIDGELNRDKGFFYHAIACGLDWDRFIQEMTEADYLWPGHYDTNGDPVDSYFSSADSLEWPKDMLTHIQRHGGPMRVKWTMTKNEYGQIKPKRNRTKIAILEMIPQQMTAADAEWSEWRTKFCDTMDMLTGQVMGNDRLTFADRANWFLTEEGINIAANFVKPIYLEWPNVAPPNGITTRIKDSESWSTDLFVAVQHAAFKLLESQESEYELAVLGLVGEGRQPNLIKWLNDNPDSKKYLEFEGEVAL